MKPLRGVHITEKTNGFKPDFSPNWTRLAQMLGLVPKQLSLGRKNCLIILVRRCVSELMEFHGLYVRSTILSRCFRG